MGLSTSLLKRSFRQVEPPPVVVENTVPELVPDVLTSIFALLEVPDLVRAGSVCSYWRSVYAELRSQLLWRYNRRQTACLVYTSESAGDNVACLYSLAEKRVYRLTLPDPPIRSRHLIGSSHGWLVTADEMSELHLVNPITGEQIALPSVITLELVTPIFDSEGVLHKYELWYPQYENGIITDHEPTIYALDELRDYLYFKAHVFPDPFTGSYIVVLIHNPEHQISFARAGDCEWTFLPPGRYYHDCLYKDGLLYVTTRIGGIDAFDLTRPTVTRKMSVRRSKDYICEQIYIVQSPWGDMLQVWREQPTLPDYDDDSGKIIMETGKIFLYEIDMAAKKLVEIDDLHDHVLFLGQSQSQCLSVEEYPHLKANCAYFTDDREFISIVNYRRSDIGVLNLGHGTIEEDIVPQLYSSWPNPIWITPNLRMMYSGLM